MAQFLNDWFQNLINDPRTNTQMNLKYIANQYRKANPKVSYKDLSEMYSKILDSDGNIINDNIQNTFGEGINTYTDDDLTAMAQSPFKDGNAGKILGAYAGAHPFKTLGTAALVGANISGLTDNDYYGGQIAGALAGGLGSKFIGDNFSPMLTMAGGALGSLFDKLRQKRRDNEAKNRYNY